MSVLSISIVDLLADLLGEGELHILAGRGSKGSDTLLKGLRHILNLRDSDALLFREVLTADPGERDGLVDTGLDGLRVGDINSRLNNSKDRDIVASLLGNLLTVVVAIAVVSISRGGLADSHHLGVALLVEGNLNSLGICSFSLWLVGVGANFIVNFFNALSAHSSCDYVALLSVNYILAGELNRVTDSLQGRSTDLSGLNHIFNTAIVLGLLVAVVGRLVVNWGMVSRGMVDYRGRFVSWGMVNNRGRFVSRGSRGISRGMMNNRGNSVMSNNRCSMDSMSYNWSSMGCFDMGESCERNCSF